MQIKENRSMLPWAVPKRDGYDGEASGLYFHFYATEAQAEKCRRWLVRNKKFTGPIRYMPGHCYQLGSIAF